MIVLRTGELKPGMRVAAPVFNSQNVLLLKVGTLLSQKNISTLKAWGISKIDIEGDKTKTVGDEQMPDESEKGTVEKTLETIFADVLEDPIMAEIMRCAGIQIRKRRTEPNTEYE